MSLQVGPGITLGPGIRFDPLIQAVTTNLQLYYNPATYVGSGGDINDLSGNDFTGNLQNIDTTNYADGYFTFNGTNSNIVTPDMTAAFNSTLAVTYEVWAYPTNIGCCVLETGHADIYAGWYDNQMEVGGDGGAPFGLYASLWYGGNFSGSGSPRTIQTSHWYQFMLTYNGTVGTAYINGVQVGTNPSFTRSAPWIDGGPGTGYFLQFGATSGTALYSQTYWSGRLGIIRAYDRGLTAAEVQQNFEATREIYGI